VITPSAGPQCGTTPSGEPATGRSQPSLLRESGNQPGPQSPLAWPGRTFGLLCQETAAATCRHGNTEGSLQGPGFDRRWTYGAPGVYLARESSTVPAAEAALSQGVRHPSHAGRRASRPAGAPELVNCRPGRSGFGSACSGIAVRQRRCCRWRGERTLTMWAAVPAVSADRLMSSRDPRWPPGEPMPAAVLSSWPARRPRRGPR
jgi:hypothetical protein